MLRLSLKPSVCVTLPRAKIYLNFVYGLFDADIRELSLHLLLCTIFNVMAVTFFQDRKDFIETILAYLIFEKSLDRVKKGTTSSYLACCWCGNLC